MGTVYGRGIAAVGDDSSVSGGPRFGAAQAGMNFSATPLLQ
jgi:hypothetical protein